MSEPCPNPRCEHGWVRITEGAVQTMVPEPTMPEEDTAEAEAERLRIAAWWSARCAAARNTWYPCRECNPNAFFMWCQGHWSVDHDRGGCDVCKAALAPRRRRHTTSTSEPVYSAIDHTEPKEREF